jgi:glycosyltransferase involved in cell wall biosynthesis
MFDLTSRNRRSNRSVKDARVLFVGHAGSPTGFARVLHSMLRELSDRYDVHHLGINFNGPAPDCGWTVHANPNPDERHAERQLDALITTLRPHLVVVLDEIWVGARHQAVWEKCRDRSKTVLYAAIDGRQPPAPQDLEALSRLDSVVAFTQFGRAIVEDAVSAVRSRDAGFRFPPVSIIPHGVDASVFYPFARPRAQPDSWTLDPIQPDVPAARAQARRLLFPERSDLDEAFIVLNANRNQPFKRIDITIRGFALFARGKPAGVKLYLHTSTATPSPGATPLADALGIRDRLLVTGVGEQHPNVSSERLNAIYNACDVGVNTSEGEGWGLVSFEHAATGAAQIVPRHSACAELWDRAALFVNPATEDRVDGYVTAGRTVTPESVADALERIYCDESLRRELSIAAYANATRRDLQWSQIGRSWDRHFHALLSST